MSLAVQHVSKAFGGFRALDDVSLDVGAGTLFGVIGPNGAGKSTLFAVISGFQPSDAGTVTLDGRDITALAPDKRARAGMVRTFQVPREFRHLTVRENLMVAAPGQTGENLISLFARPGQIRIEEKRNAERVDETLQFLRLVKVADVPSGSLSGGQKKLLELGRALMVSPKLILLDEPFAGVNPVLIEAIAERIRELNARGIGFLIIEHDLAALTRLVPQLAVMDRGRIIARGAPAQVLQDPTVREAYLGGPVVTILAVEDVRGGYGTGVDILNGISFMMQAGQIVTIAGTNGAGKSTLAKAIVGLLPDVRGSIRFTGTELTGIPTEDRIALGIGYVPQVANVFPSLTILENLRVVAGVVEQEKRIAELFATFPALAERKRLRAGTLSGGERQQLAFARALMIRPKLLILDEPTAALSPAKVGESFALIKRLPALDVSVLIIEQRARQALAISDSGCILDGGRVAMAGPASDLLADERAAEMFLGAG
jgi:branched-chain amino acid transport system ATP-binding protein